MAKYITVFEIDAPLESSVWINSEPGIWVKNLTPGSAVFVDSKGLASFYGDRNNQRKKVESVRAGGTDLSEQLTLADCRSNSASFYWDESNQFLYVHFPNTDPPSAFSNIAIGAALGWSLGLDETNDNTYSDIYYPPRLKSVPSFSKDRDSLFFGILTYGGGNVQIANEDGELDDFADLDLFGQPARIYLTTEGGVLTEAEQLFEGTVGTVTNDFATLTIQLRDKRDSFARSIPTTAISNFDDDNDGQLKPVAWGSIRQAPAYRTAASTWVFADTTYNAVSASGFQAYYDGNTITTGGAVTDGTFTYTLGAGETPDKVTVDFEVTGFATGLDILEDIFDNYLNITYNSSNYNQTEWENAKTDAKVSAVYAAEATSIRDIIEQITTDNQGVLDIQDDGRITFRIFDIDNPAVKQIQNHEDGEKNTEVIGGINTTYDVTEFLSSAEVAYDKNQSTGFYKLERDTSHETEVVSRYNEYRNKRFDTGLTSSADALALAQSIMDRSAEIVPVIEFTTFLDNYDLRILDFFVFNLARPDNTGPGLGVYEVLGYTRRITDQLIDIRARLVLGKDPIAEISNTRITEASNTRITEDGNIRITEGV
jgi:hypothetical protein